jgi:spore maturation protein CgeB
MVASRLEIVVFGLSVSSSWGNGHATLWRGLSAALAARGHRLVFFEKDVPYYAAHRDLSRLEGGELILYRELRDVRGRAREALRSADAAIVTSYCPDARAATSLVMGEARGLKVFYDLDTPVTLERLRAGEAVDYVPEEGLAGFDLVLSFTGGRALDALRRELGARAVAALHGSVDPAQHGPAPISTGRDQWDLSYLGTYAPGRQLAVNRLFLEPARRLSRRRFAIGGSMYPPDFPWRPNVFYRGHVAPPEHPAFYGASRFTLNVTRPEMAASGYCPSGRLFEAAACGVPCISDAWEGLETFFRPGQEVVVARDPEDVVAALSMSDAEARRIGRAARERTLSEHTAAHRAEELIRLLGAAASRASVQSDQGVVA